MKLNFIDLKKQYLDHKQEIDEAIQRVIINTQFINGPDVTQFENELAAFCGTKYAVGVSSGTDALLIPLLAMGIKPGDEIITTPFTFIATAEVIALLGAKTVFVDIEPETYNIDPALIEKKITPKTRAIIPVHLYGQCADMDHINAIAAKHKLFVIEDACQSIGARYKDKPACSMSLAAALSFYPGKNLGCYGDGGAILTSDEALAIKMRQISNHGQDKRYSHKYIGLNGRLDTIQAALLRVKLKYLGQWIKDRNRVAETYKEQLKGLVKVPVTADGNLHVYNQFTIRTPKRDALQQYMTENEIPTAIHYPMPLHLQEAFKDLGYKKGSFPVSEAASAEVISLPMFPEMTDDQQSMVIESVKSFYKK
jgi:UDP-2-acetamido-2-deoxy-ribo-hexuluronate aminotransferase